jgi:phosphoribosyl 1,2-cyclic phosphodiesterase
MMSGGFFIPKTIIFYYIMVFLLPLDLKRILMEHKFCSLSSGSSGNCYYIGNEFHGILIDAGISSRAIVKHLKSMGVSFQTITGVFISHNHSDHIKGLEVLTRRYKIPAFTSKKIWNSIMHSPLNMPVSGDCIRMLPLLEKIHLSGFDIEAFPVNHDAPETIGFHICAGDIKITIVTDLGYICETAAPYIKAANLLVIESNYDEQMLQNGSYPYFLKARIKSDRGHLGNHQMASFVTEHIHENLSHICLAHLSKNNNTPALALQTLQDAFCEKGITLNGKPRIVVLNRNTPSEIVRLN